MRIRATAFCLVILAAICVDAAPCTKNVVIDRAVTRARVAVPAGALGAKAELVLRDIRFDHHPGTQFHVILERSADRTKRVRAGTLSFYAAGKGPITRTFDVTDELRELAPSGDVNVVFEATPTFDSDTKLTIGEILLRAK